MITERRASRWHRAAVAAAACVALALAAACSGDSTPPLAKLPAPQGVSARAVGIGLVRVQWPAVVAPPQTVVTRYQLERRADLTGDFKMVADDIQLAPDTVIYYDTALTAETFYGYRVRAVSSIGLLSTPSNVAGARTPPLPGIVVSTNATAQSLAFASRDGYMVVVTQGTDTARQRLTPVASHRFSPLKTGAYAVALRGIPRNCGVLNGDSTRTAMVSDTGVTTLANVSFEVTCRDPSLGQVVVMVSASGKDLDADGYSVALSRTSQTGAVLKTATIAGSTGQTSFDNLQAGQYEVELSGVAPNCSLTTGTLKRTVTVAALDSDTLRYSLRCIANGPPDTRPLRLRNVFNPESAPPGATVTLEVSLDLTPRVGMGINGLQAVTFFDAGTLRFLRSESPDPLTVTANAGTPGRITWASIALGGVGPTGNATVARFVFSVVDTATSGKETTTSTEVTSATATTPPDPTLANIKADIGPDEATFTVAVGASTGNQKPVAKPNGPYTGVIGQPITFTASGSSDPDGTITSYMWSFSDGGGASGATAQHTFASAGSYTAILTVTDDKGATATAQAAVTVTSGGSQNQSPVANANGPYSGVAGQPITFSAAGSSDPDGQIIAWQWQFTDGTTASGQTVQKTFALAGSYTGMLTVTDDRGATAASTATVTVSANGGSTDKPFALRNAFGAPDANGVVTLTVSLDLTADIPETAGGEALGTFAVASLRVDPNVLAYRSFNLGGAGFSVVDGNVDLSRVVSDGVMTFSGRASSPGGGTGVITLARITFTVKGASGASVSTVTALGQLASIASLGPFDYLPRTHIEEATLVLP